MPGAFRFGVIAEAGAWLALAGAAYALTYEFDHRLEVYRFGASGWPRALILLVVLMALGQLTRGLTRAGTAPEGNSPESPPPAPHAGSRAVQAPKRVATFVLPLIYLFLVPRIGYYVLTPFFLSGYMLLLGERRVRHLVGTALVLHVGIVLAFTKLFFVQLPVGVWPGFYELSNWLLSLIQ